jgi:hypothetical protein
MKRKTTGRGAHSVLLEAEVDANANSVRVELAWRASSASTTSSSSSSSAFVALQHKSVELGKDSANLTQCVEHLQEVVQWISVVRIELRVRACTCVCVCVCVYARVYPRAQSGVDVSAR